jgi:uncharacterized protein YdaU (DUF1376 family)
MAIQKPEWFKVDPAKFLSDGQVDAMSTLELGACFRLLCRQWLDGFIPDDLRLLARLCRLDDAAMAEAWVTLSAFFPTMEPGKCANRFMWIEREKVVTELERRSDEGTRAARKRWDAARSKVNATPIAKPNGSPIPLAMQEQTRAEQTRTEESSLSELKSSSDQEDAVPQKKTPQPPSKEACQLAALLKSEILRNKADFKISQAQERKWAVTTERMLRLDGRSQEQVAALIRWAQQDEFWMANVLSMETLREKFDQLSLKAQAKNQIHPAKKLPADYISASEQMRREHRQQESVVRQ